jgi:hypothetical protein
LKNVRAVLDPGKIKIHLLHIGELTRRRDKVVYRFLDKNKIGDFHGDIWIYGDRVAFISFIGKFIAVVLEDKEFAETARVLFDAAWEGAEKDR